MTYDPPELNKKLLTTTMEYILANPDKLNQTVWRCQTGMCFAGTAATVVGSRWASDDPGDPLYDQLMYDPKLDQRVYAYNFFGDDANLVVGCRDRARHTLGLTSEEADALFDSDNDLDTLQLKVAILCDEHYDRQLYDTIDYLYELNEAKGLVDS